MSQLDNGGRAGGPKDEHLGVRQARVIVDKRTEVLSANGIALVEEVGLGGGRSEGGGGGEDEGDEDGGELHDEFRKEMNLSRRRRGKKKRAGKKKK